MDKFTDWVLALIAIAAIISPLFTTIFMNKNVIKQIKLKSLLNDIDREIKSLNSDCDNFFKSYGLYVASPSSPISKKTFASASAKMIKYEYRTDRVFSNLVAFIGENETGMVDNAFRIASDFIKKQQELKLTELHQSKELLDQQDSSLLSKASNFLHLKSQEQ